MVAVGKTYFGKKRTSSDTITASVVSRNSAFTTKYRHGPSPYWSNGTNITLTKYTEVLLNYAEALFKSGEPKQAYLELNKVRLRAKIAANPFRQTKMLL
ncbi:MAG: RagB/SusD family nutrient uptake outer membrane protein [Chitinophagaceae bacterium]|nr:RagB/SusD family nutrient uptake outer membrane protein [Chitinophagaceae bacterium]